MMSSICTNGMRLFINNATATSFAAFMAAGIVPPSLPAAYASPKRLKANKYPISRNAAFQFLRDVAVSRFALVSDRDRLKRIELAHAYPVNQVVP